MAFYRSISNGARGLGFAVGTEPLPALFASMGCEITATDVASTDPAASKWIDGGQHSEQLLQLNAVGICPPDAFSNRVHFQPLNMNEIPADLSSFDFTWSACALEHLGSIRRGQDFLLNQMACLKPGGFAVHTTEFNLSSNWRTVDWNDTVLFRRRDIERVAALLHDEGHSITLNFDTGAGRADRHVDVPPFTEVHLRLLIAKLEVTSIGLIIQKGLQPSPHRMPRPPSLLEQLDYATRVTKAGIHRLMERARPAIKKAIALTHNRRLS